MQSQSKRQGRNNRINLIMGYWNEYSNFHDWAEAYEYKKKCNHCGEEFIPNSGNQKYCSREENPACDDDRISLRLWKKGKHPLQLTKQ